MTIIEWLGLGIVVLIIVSIIISYIQIRVWLHFGEKFLLKKSNKLKKESDEKIKE